MKNISSLSINFVTEKENRSDKIVYIVWNDWFSNKQKYQSNFDYANEMAAITNLASNSNLNHKFDKIMTYSLSDAIELAADAGFGYAVVQTPGHIIYSKFPSAITEYIKSIDDDWSIMGHILDFKKFNNWLTLHDQCFVLNLKHVKYVGTDIGEPNQGYRIFPDYARSDDNFHDDYTPTWIKFNEQYYKAGGYGLGWKWLSYGLLNNSVKVFSNEVRSAKVHLYPENPGNKDAWYDRSNAPDNNQLKSILTNLNISDPRQHVFNNEDVFNGLDNIIKDKIENVVVAASGFYGLQVSKLFDAKKIIYYDQDLKLLNFRKNFNDQWDGKEAIEKYYLPGMNVFDEPNLPKVPAIDGTIIKSEEELIRHLENFKSLPKEYHHLDIIKDWQDFEKTIPSEGTTFIWLDSIYTYWYNIWESTPKKIYQSYYGLIYKLQQRPNKIWINVKEPSGQYRIFEVHEYTPDTMQAFFSRYEHFA